MTSSPCDWPLQLSSTCDPTAYNALDEETKSAVREMAVNLLWSWTGRRYGLCAESVRPCRDDCNRSGSSIFPEGPLNPSQGIGSGWQPVLLAGQWFNLRCGACGSSCTCGVDESKAIELPGYIHTVTEVWIEGARLDPAAYVLRSGVLYRTDGGSWPACNNPLGDPREADSGAWEITVQVGTPVPAAGKLAAGVLATELAKALCNDKDCNLPQRVQSVTRQGVSIGAVLDSFEDLREGRTGIWLIDSWVAGVNAPVPARPAVYSPDASRSRGTFRSLGIGRR